MPFVPVPHLFSVTQQLIQPNGDQALNVLHGRMTTGSIDETTADAISQAIGQSWHDHLRGWVSAHVSLGFYSIRDLSVSGGRTYTHNAGFGAGTDSGTILPEQIAVCTTLNKGSGPSQRGRVYHGGFCTDAIDTVSSPPLVKAALIADIDLWIEDVGAAFSDNGAVWVVYSRKLSTTTDVDVTRTPTDQRFDVQRRRANHRPIL